MWLPGIMGQQQHRGSFVIYPEGRPRAFPGSHGSRIGLGTWRILWGGAEPCLPCSYFLASTSVSLLDRFIHSTVERHLACFQFLSIISNTVMNFLVNIRTNFSLCIFRSERLGPGWNTFSFRRCCPAGFVSGLPIYAPVSSSQWLYILTSTCFSFGFKLL